MNTDNLYNIFYADDDLDDQEVFREVMAEINEDIFIFTQNNGDELLNLLKSPPPRPHVVFLDLNMPVKNGYDVLKEIRQSEKFRHLPVIIFSTSGDEDAISRTRNLGATLYVQKPDDYNELKQILRELLAINWENFSPGAEYVYSY
jgi:CheY-like chemotaxis protein